MSWIQVSKPMMFDRGEMRLDPMPQGPYILSDQWDAAKYEVLRWMDAVHLANSKRHLLAELPPHLTLGTVLLAQVGGKAVRAAYRYDSSD